MKINRLATHANTPMALTIGTFDGVHVGHVHVIESLASNAQRRNLPWAVVTFEPHPREFFERAQQPRLTTLREKLEVFQQLGIPEVWVLPFDARIAKMSAQSFVTDILQKRLAMTYLLVGDDFRFGHARGGDFTLLQKLGASSNFSVEAADSFVCVAGERVASSAIRTSLKEGRLDQAQRWLGRPYGITGRVIRGQRLGTQLGYPTANIDLRSRVCPLTGIFIVQVRKAGASQSHPAVASLGIRPTLPAPHHFTCEVHLLDFAGDLYGEYLSIEFLQHLREEKKFTTMQELQRAISQDVQDAARYFTQSTPTVQPA